MSMIAPVGPVGRLGSVLIWLVLLSLIGVVPLGGAGDSAHVIAGHVVNNIARTVGMALFMVYSFAEISNFVWGVEKNSAAAPFSRGSVLTYLTVPRRHRALNQSSFSASLISSRAWRPRR